MRIAVATLLLACAIPAAHAEDRYSGRYAADCGRYVCELDIRPAGQGWSVRWTASDPTKLDAEPVCSFKTTAELGSAAMAGRRRDEYCGREGAGAAVRHIRFGAGACQLVVAMAGCPGVSPKSIYEAFGDR
jgi:hypothetical protein